MIIVQWFRKYLLGRNAGLESRGIGHVGAGGVRQQTD